jgi:hypothetical protein
LSEFHAALDASFAAAGTTHIAFKKKSQRPQNHQSPVITLRRSRRKRIGGPDFVSSAHFGVPNAEFLPSKVTLSSVDLEVART